MLVSVNMSNFAFHWGFACLRCCDRGCHTTRRYTKQLTQVDYEDKNTYFDYDMTYRYCNILTVVFVCLIYSSGIPVLYPIVCLYFGVVYVCDKYMLFRWYKKPAVLDGHIALNSLEWFKFALLAHVICGSIMYSSSEILTTPETEAWLKDHWEDALLGAGLG